MKSACSAMLSPGSAKLSHLFPEAISADLKTVANTFISLQELRHSADYNLGETFIREDVLVHIERVESAFKSWKRETNSANAKAFLLLLLIYR
jgi:hypothetical protein